MNSGSSSTPFIGHRIAKERFDPVEAILYEYVLAGNGVVLKAHRDEFTVSVPLVYREIKGLPEPFVGIKWHKPKVPGRIWDEICLHAKTSNSKDNFKEELYLIYWDKGSDTLGSGALRVGTGRGHQPSRMTDGPNTPKPVSRFTRTRTGHTSSVRQMIGMNQASSASSGSLWMSMTSPN